MYDFNDRIVVISGAMGGIGEKTSDLFAAAGAKVIGVDRQADKGGKRAKAYRARGCDVQMRTLDVTSVAQVDAFAHSLRSEVGHVDVLINNAGILHFSSIVATDPDEWDRVQAVNMKSVFLMTRAIAPLMETGVILNMSSSAAVAPTPNGAAYSVAKAGVVTFSKIAALELGPKIRVNAVCPGAIDTQMPRKYLEGHPHKDAIVRSMIDRTIVKRLGQPGEIADLIAFLASDKAGFITGAVFSADGGFFA